MPYRTGESITINGKEEGERRKGKGGRGKEEGERRKGKGGRGKEEGERRKGKGGRGKEGGGVVNGHGYEELRLLSTRCYQPPPNGGMG